jgi:outer membrane protein OmpA-like peptidoglycan-associated protein
MNDSLFTPISGSHVSGTQLANASETLFAAPPASMDSVLVKKPSLPDSLKTLGGGEGGRGRPGSGSGADSTATGPMSDQEFYGSAVLGSHEPEPVADPVEVVEKATLVKLGWVEPETKYQTEAKVFAEFKLPESIKDKKRVDFELHRKDENPNDPPLTANGYCDEAGRCEVKFSIFKPKQSSPDTVESLFWLKVKHCTGDWETKPESERLVNQTAELDFHFDMASGLHFVKNKSFIPGSQLEEFKKLESQFKAWKRKHPDGKVVIYGHAEKDEPDPYALSQRRAQIVYAFLTGDHETFWKIAESENWGTWEFQSILHAFGMYVGPINGVETEDTKTAMKKAVTHLNTKEGCDFQPESRFSLMQIRREVYRLYITSPKRAVTFAPKDFREVSGNAHVGCGCANRYQSGDKAHSENRRATLLFVSELKDFPKRFPCQSTAKPCEAQFAKEGKRNFEGFQCQFYDEMAKNEKKVEAAPVEKGEVAKDETKKYDRISFEGYEGQGYVIKDFKSYKGKAIQRSGSEYEVNSAGLQLPDEFNNQCAALVQFFGIPQATTWKKGPQVCKIKPGDLPEGTVIATLRDGKYHNDSSGRSHVGIYLAHDDYEQFLQSDDNESGVKIFDQSKSKLIAENKLRYKTDANKEGKTAKSPWKDKDNVVHTLRTNWINDGEEYYVLLTE